MSNRTLNLDERLYEYLCSISLREPEILRRLREETALMSEADMQISPEQGQFMAMLIKLTGARRCLEVGAFTGYSALVCALALPDDGRILTLDVSQEWTDRARTFWQEAGVEQKITLSLGPAVASMQGLLAEGLQETFDFIFIDADKVSYPEYFELGLKLIRPGGLMLFDNVLWSGKVADPEHKDADTVALRILNEILHQDPRIDISMVPIADGLTLARKR